MKPFRRRILLPVVLVLSALTSCGTYVPELQEFWGSTEDASVKVNLISSQVECELRRAVQQVFWDRDHYKPVFIGGPQPPPKVPTLDWFETWSAQATLTLTIVENSALTPGVSLITVLPNAIDKFANGNVTTAQSRTVGIGGSLSSTATRTDKLSMFYSVRELRRSVSSRGLSCIPGERASADLFIQSDLKLRDWLRAALRPYYADVIHYYSNKTPSNAISHAVKFQIVSNGSVNPQWKLVRVTANTGNTPFLSGGRDRTQDLTITFGPTATGSGGNPELATAAQLSHFAQQIGIAVGEAINRPQQ